MTDVTGLSVGSVCSITPKQVEFIPPSPDGDIYRAISCSAGYLSCSQTPFASALSLRSREQQMWDPALSALEQRQQPEALSQIAYATRHAL